MNPCYARAASWVFPARLTRLSRKELLWELAWVLGITFGIVALQHLGLLSRLESLGLDAIISLSAPRQSDDIAIVQITDDDFHNRELFNGHALLSPKSCKTLSARFRRRTHALLASIST